MAFRKIHLLILAGILIIFSALLIVGFLRTYKLEHSLNQKLFLSGQLPQNPNGFFPGSAGKLSTTWKGKKFDAEKSAGINIFSEGGSPREAGKEVEKYPFKTYIGKGIADKNLDVFKIDYNIPENPIWLKPILDEVVEVEPGKYLGKAHFRLLPNFALTLTYFRLENPNQLLKAGNKPDYLLVLVGDSMTEKLGNADELRTFLSGFYPKKTFDVYNYGFGSTSILSLPDRLEKETIHGRKYQPINDINFNLILIESFGYNPLSEYPLEQGLKKQNETLDQVVNIITEKHPKSSIVFVGTIAPSRRLYAYRIEDVTPEKRAQIAMEREAYIKNHMDYARSHDIPVIDIFDVSKDGEDGKLDYIDDKDYIHPSPKGVVFISEGIANFIYENNLLK